MTIEELFKLYLETLDDYGRDESYATDKDLHSIGLNGFLKWLIDQPYEVKVIKA